MKLLMFCKEKEKNMKKSELKEWVKNHKKELIISGIGVVGSTLGVKYLKDNFRVLRKTKKNFMHLEFDDEMKPFMDRLRAFVYCRTNTKHGGFNLNTDMNKEEVISNFNELMDLAPDDALFSMFLIYGENK